MSAKESQSSLEINLPEDKSERIKMFAVNFKKIITELFNEIDTGIYFEKESEEFIIQPGEDATVNQEIAIMEANKKFALLKQIYGVTKLEDDYIVALDKLMMQTLPEA